MHSVIMAGTSEYYFNNLLNTDEHDTLDECTCTTLDDPYPLNVESEALEMIITFCYSGAVELTVDNVEYVLAGAKELQIDSLVSLCADMLEDTLSINNCIQYLQIADKHDFGVLRVNALAIISGVLPHVNKLPEFFHISGAQIIWLLEQLASSHDDMFGNLLDSIQEVETTFTALNLDGDSQSVFRAAVSQNFCFYFLFRCNNNEPVRKFLTHFFMILVYRWIFDAQ